jgi:hypothetical protein
LFKTGDRYIGLPALPFLFASGIYCRIGKARESTLLANVTMLLKADLFYGGNHAAGFVRNS